MGSTLRDGSWLTVFPKAMLGRSSGGSIGPATRPCSWGWLNGQVPIGQRLTGLPEVGTSTSARVAYGAACQPSSTQSLGDRSLPVQVSNDLLFLRERSARVMSQEVVSMTYKGEEKFEVKNLTTSKLRTEEALSEYDPHSKSQLEGT